MQDLPSLTQKRTLDLTDYSIIWLKTGSLTVQSGFQRWHLSSDQLLVLNPDQSIHLTPSTEHSAEVRLINISKDIFLDQLVKLAGLEAYATLQHFFAEKSTAEYTDFELCERVYDIQDSGLGPILRGSVINGHAGSSQALSHADTDGKITEALISLQNTAYQQMLSLTSAKLSTKRELYRRLCIARTHMHAHLDQALDLDTLAQVACLSKYHFIRLFKAFGQTPRQYLITLRLDQARTLLIKTDKTFHEICHEVGLKDSSSSRPLVQAQFWCDPHIYRQQFA